MASERTVRFNFEVNAKTDDIAKLEKGLTALTKSLPPLSVDLDRARGDILALGQSNLQTTALINGQITALRELQTHVATTSPLYRRLGTDMGQLRGRLGELEASMKGTRTAAQELATALNSGIGGSSNKIEGQVAKLRNLMGDLKHNTQELANAYARLNQLETVNNRRSGRQAAIAGNSAVYSATMTSGYGGQDRLPGLPNSVNGLNQRLSELSEDLGNVNRGSQEYINIMREMETINTRLASSNNILSTSINQVARAQSAARRQQEAGIGNGFLNFSRNPTAITDQLADQAATARAIRRNQERVANSPMARQFAADIQAMNRTATLALPAGDTSLPAIRGGARSAFGGNANMEFLGGNRSDEQAAYATRVADRTSNLAQNLRQQNDELNQGFAQQAEIITKGKQRSAELMGITSAAAANNFVSRNAKTPLFGAIEGIGLSKITNQTQLMGQSYGEVATSIRAVTAVSDNSTNSLNQQRQAWQQLGDAVALTPRRLREVNGELQRIDRQLEKRQPRGNRLANFGQTAGAVAASGVFGGPEGLAGAAIGSIWGPVGALAGGTIGAQVGMFRQQIGASAEYSAQIDKLNIALRSVAGSAKEYEAAQLAINSVSVSLNIPILDATQAFTRLSASVKGAGGKISDAEVVFSGVTNAIKATGGSAEDAQSAILAMSQVFGKGKVSAEELQGQLGERLPGAVTLFAQATGRTLPQLSKDLQNGAVGLNDLMKFVIALNEKYGASSLKMAASSAEAGARMKVSLDGLSKSVGSIVAPIGAATQDVVARFADMATRSLRYIGLVKDGFSELGAAGRGKDLQQRATDAYGALGAGTTENSKRAGFNAANELVRTITPQKNVAGIKQNITAYQQAVNLYSKITADGLSDKQIQLLTDNSAKASQLLKAETVKLKELQKQAKPTKFEEPAGGSSDKETKTAAQIAAEQQQLRENDMQAQVRVADAVFQREIELDRKRYDLRKELIELERQTAEGGLFGVRREVQQAVNQLKSQLEGLDRRKFEARNEVRIAEQKLSSAVQVESITSKGTYKQGGYGPGGPNAYAPHFDIARADGKPYSRTALDQYVVVNGRPLSSGVTVKGGEYGASRDGGTRKHGAIDYAFAGNAELSLTNGAKWLKSNKGSYGDNTVFMDGKGEIYRIIHGSFNGQSSTKLPTGVAAQMSRSMKRSANVAIAGLGIPGTQDQAETQDNFDKQKIEYGTQFTQKLTQSVREQTQSLADNNAVQLMRNRLQLQGMRPELIDLEAQKTKLLIEQKAKIEQLDANRNEPGVDYAKTLTEINDSYAKQIELLREITDAQISFNDAARYQQDYRLGDGINEGAKKYVESIGTMHNATSQLAQTGIKGVEDAIFQLTTTGTANFGAFAASILQDTARMIIQQMILRTILQAVGAIGGGGGGGGGGGDMSSMLANQAPYLNANGNAYGANGIIPFANGGIFDSPTLFKFAKGGAMANGVLGEAGPEAIMPLRRGPDGQLGVAAGGGGGGTTNISIAVDASGTKAQGDQGKSGALARDLAAVVDQRLIYHKRPGGILA